MTLKHSITEMDLHAYADGQLDLDPGRKAAVEAYLAAHPDKHAFVEHIRSQNDRIRALFGKPPREEAGHLAQAFGPRRTARALPLSWTGAGRVAASLAIGVLAGYMLSSLPGWEADEPLRMAAQNPGVQGAQSAGVQEAAYPAAATGEQRQPGLAFSSLAPDLTPMGFRYDAHEVEYEGGAVARLRLHYLNETGASAVLTVSPRASGARQDVDMVRADGRTHLRWSDGVFGYELVSDAPSGQVNELAAMLASEPGRPRLETEPPAETMQQVDAYEPNYEQPGNIYELPSGNGNGHMPALLPANGTSPAEIHPQG